MVSCEIECYINKNKEVCFIEIIEESVSADGVTEKLNKTVQGTVVGNSPYSSFQSERPLVLHHV